MVTTYITLHAGVVDDFVDVVGSNTRLSFTGCDIEHLASQSADLAHTFLLLLCENLNPVPSNENLVEHQRPVLPLFAHNVLRTCSLLGIP